VEFSVASNVLIPEAVIMASWTILVLVGLPLTLACLPSYQRSLIIPLSPIVAMALVAIAYEFSFFVLIQPYRPLAVHSILAVSTIALLAVSLKLKHESLFDVASDVTAGLKKQWPLLAVPVLGTMILSAFFAVNGLELLSGSEDEFAYVEVTRQIMEHVFTHDALDFPWGRADHYLGDLNAHSQAYQPQARLGAFFLLADMSRLFRISLERTFPLLMGVGIAVGAASLSIIGVLVPRARAAIIAAQIMFVTSWLVVMLHIQGSLSHMTTMGIRLGGLAYILWAIVYSNRIGTLALAGILGAGWLVLYHESIGFGLALPVAAALFATFISAIKQRSTIALTRAVRMIGFVLIVFVLESELFNVTVAVHLGHAISNITRQHVALLDTLIRANAGAARILAPVLGYNSYYDDSSANTSIPQLLLPFGSAVFLSGASLAALGFWRRLPFIAGVAWAVVPLVLAAVAIATALNENYFLVTRSAQMAMPHIYIGLTLLIFARRGVLGAGSKESFSGMAGLFGLGTRIGAGLFWGCFVALNSYTVWRTIDYVNRFSQATDARLRHFDPDSASWARLRQLVTSADGAPVLISGFHDTPTPQMIALGLRESPNLVGSSITSFWRSVDPSVSFPHGFNTSHHWLSNDQLVDLAKANPMWNWPPVYDALLARTRKAIVPVSGPYPAEWGEWPSLFNAVARRFPNLCDVVERDQPAFAVEDPRPATGHDEIGPYWTLDAPIEAQPRSHDPAPTVVEFRYTGPAPQLFVDGAEIKLLPAHPLGAKDLVLNANFPVASGGAIEVRASSETRMRSIGVYILATSNP